MRTLTPYFTNRRLASDLFDEMDRFFENYAGLPTYDERAFAPATDVTEAEDHFLMSLDIPGMRKEDIKIEMNDNMLSISGERKREFTADAKQKVQRFEKSYGFFKRSFSLPTIVDGSGIEANYQDGVLKLYLPKTQAAKPRQIEVQAGKGGFFEKLLGKKEETEKRA